MFLGIEIGSTKLQLACGDGLGSTANITRIALDPYDEFDKTRHQVETAIREWLNSPNINRAELRGAGIGFEGPVDALQQTPATSYEEDWDRFPLRNWISDLVELPAVLHKSADLAGLAESLYGAGVGMSPLFFIGLGPSLAGSLIVNEQIYPGAGRGAAEIGQIRIRQVDTDNEHMFILDTFGSEDAIAAQATFGERIGGNLDGVLNFCNDDGTFTAAAVASAARVGDRVALNILNESLQALAEGISQIIALLCPGRIVIAATESLLSEEIFFQPLRQLVDERIFEPFKGLTDIVPATLGDKAVLYGAMTMARRSITHIY